MRLIFCFVTVFGFVASTSAETRPNISEENWPSWRGPFANGVAPENANPPLHWDANTNIRWKFALPGRGSATPVIWEDQVFVVSASKTDREATADELPKPDTRFVVKTDRPTSYYQFEVFSLDRNTGRTNWRKVAAEAVPHEGHHPTHSYAGGSPTTDGQRLYVSFGSFGIYTYDLAGTLLWKRDFGRMYTRFGWGEAVTPVVHGDSLILNWDQEADSKLIVLNAITGQTRWEAPRNEKTSWNTPVVVEHHGKTLVIVNATNRATAYDLNDGKIVWEVGGMTVNAIPSILTSNGVAYIMSGYQGAAAVAVPLESVGDLANDSEKVIWRYNKGTPYVPSPVLVDGRLYFTKENTQVLTILDAKTGTPILERGRLPDVTTFFSSPVAAAGRLYFVDQLGTTLIIKAGLEIEVLAVNKLNEPINSSPALSGRMLFLRGDQHVYAIEER